MQREKNIVRAKVFGRKDNPTPEIVMQRIRVRLLGKLARRILPIIRKGFAGVGNGTAYNAFMSANMIQVTVDENMNGSIDFEGLKLASGLLYPSVTYGDLLFCFRNGDYSEPEFLDREFCGGFLGRSGEYSRRCRRQCGGCLVAA